MPVGRNFRQPNRETVTVREPRSGPSGAGVWGDTPQPVRRERPQLVRKAPVAVQPIQESQVATSIAPDPWAGTGPARMEIASQSSGQRVPAALPLSLIHI